MKGRQTSYQRFSSLLGTTGSVVNKFFRSLGGTLEGRDSELMGKTQRDMSDNNGIYNKTLKIEDDLTYDYEKEDLGEEVYGCISHPFGKDSIYIEKDSKTAIEGRKTKRVDSPHFEDKKREWYYKKANKTYEDCALIPQENLPLVVNSKFEMRYWDANTDNTTTIPKGAGFTSGSLVRPISFIKEAKQIKKNGCRTVDAQIGGASHILKDVPLEIAHQLINCCKEIELKGNVSYSITRKNKRCTTWDGDEDGPTGTKKEWEGEYRIGCPPGQCKDQGGSQTASCMSSERTTKIMLDGKLEMTAYRHKQVADIWGKEPKILEISGNSFWGGLERAALRKISSSGCDPIDLESGPNTIPTKLPDPTIKQVLEFEKQTKLSSGCLSYPFTNNSMIIAKEEDNLKTEKLDGYTDICEPDSVITNNYLYGPAQISAYLGESIFSSSDFQYSYPSGINIRTIGNSDIAVRPIYVSGPSLYCYFGGIGWDYSKIGEKEPEVPWHQDNCGIYSSNYKDWKMTWNSTKLKKTYTGDCAQGFSGFDRFNRKNNSCDCGDDCEHCKSDWGKLKLLCECEPQCANALSGNHTPENPNPCVGPYISGCDGMYGFSFTIGKYVGVQLKDYPYEESAQVYNVAPVPLATKAGPAAQEDLVLWFEGIISDALAYFPNYSAEMQLTIYPNRESVDKAFEILQENSLIRYEKKSVGSVTLTVGEWSNSFPIWVILSIRKETTCKTPATGLSINVQNTLVEGDMYKVCKNCEDDSPLPTCCDDAGCGGVDDAKECCNDKNCGIDDPCALAIYVVPINKRCDANSITTCEGACKDIELGECGCCGCKGFEDDPDYYDDDCEIRCKPYTANCKPYKVKTDFENLSCYGDAHEEDVHEVSIDLTIEFKPFKEME